MTETENGPHGPFPFHINNSSRRIDGIEVPPVNCGSRWGMWGGTSSTEGCGKTPIRVGEKTTGKLLTFTPPWKSWACHSCAYDKVDRLLPRLAKCLAGEASLWTTTMPFDEAIAIRLRQRRSGKGTNWLAIRRYDKLHYVSTSPLPGRLQPTDWEELSPGDVLDLLASKFLALPGVKRVAASTDWQPPKAADSGPSNYHGFGAANIK